MTKNECINCENRLIMLTDVCDNSITHEKEFVDKVSKENNINLSIIGISDDFKS